ncbi:thiamine pyrophosphate-dependent enzyme, partial [[Kitasatospora] papulosa]|uniref:thiamine pyrophosphate-dependent enzyme n=1 Tax=[Kitasatospora] papulosa TaxID=1464011 RepID=UPI0036AE9E08
SHRRADAAAAPEGTDRPPPGGQGVPRAAPPPQPPPRAEARRGEARRPVILAGHGAARGGAAESLTAFATALDVSTATTFHGKGVLPDDHPCATGTFGFMRRDYTNFGFEEADVVIAVGYELQEFDPSRINPDGDKKIVHIHRFPAEVDDSYSVDVGIIGDISASLDALAAELDGLRWTIDDEDATATRALLAKELEQGAADERYPLAPQRVIADTRAALGRDDIVLVDTGALKMWMARLYPTYAPNTCIISNGLSTMGFSLPGALAVQLARPQTKVLAAVGDGSFLMHSQEIETAVRENIPLTVLIWEDNGYGLIKWKMDLEVGENSNTDFGNPDIVQYARSFGAKGYHIESAGDLLPTLRDALADPGVSIINCPVDYAENMNLIEHLGHLDSAL